MSYDNEHGSDVPVNLVDLADVVRLLTLDPQAHPEEQGPLIYALKKALEYLPQVRADQDQVAYLKRQRNDRMLASARAFIASGAHIERRGYQIRLTAAMLAPAYTPGPEDISLSEAEFRADTRAMEQRFVERFNIGPLVVGVTEQDIIDG